MNSNPLHEDDGNLLDEVVLDRICLDVSTVGTECNNGRNFSMCQSMMKKSMSQGIRGSV